MKWSGTSPKSFHLPPLQSGSRTALQGGSLLYLRGHPPLLPLAPGWQQDKSRLLRPRLTHRLKQKITRRSSHVGQGTSLTSHS